MDDISKNIDFSRKNKVFFNAKSPYVSLFSWFPSYLSPISKHVFSSIFHTFFVFLWKNENNLKSGGKIHFEISVKYGENHEDKDTYGDFVLKKKPCFFVKINIFRNVIHKWWLCKICEILFLFKMTLSMGNLMCFFVLFNVLLPI